MFPPMIRGECMDILLLHGLTGWMCRGSGGAAQDFILGLDSRSLRFSDLDGDGVRGAWIGITTGSSFMEGHISRAARHFSIAEDTTVGGAGLGEPEDSAEGWVTGERIADMLRPEEVRECGREHSAGWTTAGRREDSRREGKAVLGADSTAGDSAAEASTAVVADVDSEQASAVGPRERGQQLVRNSRYLLPMRVRNRRCEHVT